MKSGVDNQKQEKKKPNHQTVKITADNIAD